MIHRFFVCNKDISAGQVVITGSRVHQIRDVLRMKIGDEIIVFDNTGFEYSVSLTNISQKEVVGKVIEKKQCETEPRTNITLYQSLLAREKFEFVLQKCTEIGLTCIVPIITERSIVRKPVKITPQKLIRFESIITEAAEQSARGKIPSLKNPMSITQALSELGNFDICLVGSTQKGCASLKQILCNNDSEYVNIALFIGPEGGFSEGEHRVFGSSGVSFFTLGERILRTETAAVVASAIILHELEL